ncbi:MULTISPECIES: hypothetical protein [unclassified Rhizobium]|uniref:hypothetical protein n=1 Tax=unclassified Rhizobium TaxID=2613769 RepID=UPI000EA93CE4|nr:MULTISPECIES: hypothetical protein [unclassified Rhizobium]AYG65280.1 hypothetical protein CCGE531_04220 [Rhizobium sp. CCGE531]AYG71764.1 hypothetical protein CCGE532_04215 [Rhizobium sp. CCGE532]
MADRASGNARSLQGLAAILAALSLALFAWIYAGFVRAFSAAAAGQQMLDARIGGYERDDVIAMLRYLKDHPDPAIILHSMYLGPELIFPLVLGGLMFCLLRLIGPSGFFFGRPIPPGAKSVIFCLPIFYAVVDYAENIAGLLLYPPAMPSDSTVTLLSSVLPVIVRLKFLTLVVTVILLARFAIFRYLSRDGARPS